MNWRADIVAFILGQTDISALIQDRLAYLQLSSEDPLPAIAYTEISNVPDYDHQGETGFLTSRIQYDLISNDPVEVTDLANFLRIALSGFQGSMGETNIGSCFQQNEIHVFNHKSGIYRIIQDFKFVITNIN